MKIGKITAKLRDAIPLCLMVEDKEVKQYKNIELPDALKEVEMADFHFNVHMDGKITFEIHYEQGILPEVFPEARTRVSRTAQKAAKTEREVAPAEETTIPAQEETALAVIPEATTANPVDAGEPVEAAEEINKETLGDETINASRLPEGGADKGKGKKSKNRSVKYICPECGATIRRTKEVNVVCGIATYPSSRNDKSASRKKNGWR